MKRSYSEEVIDTLDTSATTNDPLKSILPLARVKKVMRLDEALSHTVGNQHSFMLSAESVPLVAKAADLFIEKLTQASWKHTSAAGRRTLQKSDVAAACFSDESFDFLLDLFPSNTIPQSTRLVDIESSLISEEKGNVIESEHVELTKIPNEDTDTPETNTRD